MNRVFVYGTLKTGGKLRGLNRFEGATIINKAYTEHPDFDMIDLGAFPAAVPGNSVIQGEVWEIDEYTFGELDTIEGYPTFYNRQLVETTEGSAWMYYIDNIDSFNHTKSSESTRINTTNQTLSWVNE